MATNPPNSPRTSSNVRVPPVRVVFDESDREWIFKQLDEVLSGGMVAAGKKVEELEQFWAAYTGCRNAVAVANGGAALNAIMAGLDISGKDVLVPTNTFIATPNAVVFAGGNPIFMDADKKTLGVTLDEVKNKYTPNTVGVLIVHIGGIVSPETPAIADWCKDMGIWLVEDAAHAHGSEFNGTRAGHFGVAGAYSFFATKTMTSGEGGMIVCDDDGLADFCRRHRDYSKRTPAENIHTGISPNSRISEISAVLGLSQSHRLDEFIEAREKVANQYTKELQSTLELVLPADRSSWYKYITLLPEEIDPARFRSEMRERNISPSGSVYDVPMHLQPVFEHMELNGLLPISEDICVRHLCLPIYYGMTDDQVNHVIATVQELVSELSPK